LVPKLRLVSLSALHQPICTQIWNVLLCPIRNTLQTRLILYPKFHIMAVLKKNTPYLDPAVIVGHVAGVQNSIRVPYKMLTWLKKSTAVDKKMCTVHDKVSVYDFSVPKISKKSLLLTASHSLSSSPGGSRTASLKLPLPKVASICFFSCTPYITHTRK
jgi:hypothetical protein